MMQMSLLLCHDGVYVTTCNCDKRVKYGNSDFLNFNFKVTPSQFQLLLLACRGSLFI